MDAALNDVLTSSAQDREIAATVRRERGRLLAFIRRRVLDATEAEDVLQEALYGRVADAGGTQSHHRPLSQEEARAVGRPGRRVRRGRRGWRPGGPVAIAG